MMAQAKRAARAAGMVGVEADEEDDEEAEAQGLDMLDVLEGMSGHFHEHHADILAWPWKLFCLKWVRMLRAAREEVDRREEREIEADIQRMRNGG